MLLFVYTISYYLSTPNNIPPTKKYASEMNVPSVLSKVSVRNTLLKSTGNYLHLYYYTATKAITGEFAGDVDTKQNPLPALSITMTAVVFDEVAINQLVYAPKYGQVYITVRGGKKEDAENPQDFYTVGDLDDLHKFSHCDIIDFYEAIRKLYFSVSDRSYDRFKRMMDGSFWKSPAIAAFLALYHDIIKK